MSNTPTTFRRRNYGSGHAYWDGDRKVPGVTAILDAGIPKSNLIKWAGDEVAEWVVDRLTLHDGHVYADDLIRDVRAVAKYPIPSGLPRVKLAKELSFAPTRTRDAGGLKGQQVHKIAHKLAETGEWTPRPEDQHLEGYADALADWWQRWDPSGLVLVETSVLNRSAFYAGTFDLYAERCGGWGRCLVDYKAARGGIYGETALQLAAYRFAEVYLDGETLRPMPEVDYCLGVWVQPDGTHTTYPFEADAEAFRIFRCAYQAAMFLAGPELMKLDGPPPVQLVKGDPVQPIEPAA